MQDEREKRARDLYERVRAKDAWPWDAPSWEDLTSEVGATAKPWWLLLVDVIGEIERERTANVKASLGAPTNDPADNWIAWRGSATDFVTDMREVIPPVKLTAIKAMLGAFNEARQPLTLTPQREADIRARAATVGEMTWSAGLDRQDRIALLAEVDSLRKVRQPLTEAEARAWAESHLSEQQDTCDTIEDEIRLLTRTIAKANRGDIPPEMRPSAESMPEWHREQIERRVAAGERATLPADYAARRAAGEGGHGMCKPAEHPRDHVEDEGTMLAYGTWQPDPRAPDPEDSTLCGGCRAPRNAIHSPLCPTRAGEDVGRLPVEMAVTTGEPWTPKPGARVRTRKTLIASFPMNIEPKRRADAAGEVLRRNEDELADEPWFDVRHDDGSEAPYHADELRPEPAKVGTSYPTPEHASEPDDICKPCTEALGSPSPCAIAHDFGPGAYPARRPWDGPRRYRSDDRDMPGHDLDLMIRPPDGNGDWYVSILPHEARGGPAVRVTTSGTPPGQHGVCVAVARLYEAMLPNATTGDTPTRCETCALAAKGFDIFCGKHMKGGV